MTPARTTRDLPIRRPPRGSPGSRAPTRTSRGPVRNALPELRTEGLIGTTRSRPSRVAARKAHQAVDVSIPFTRWAQSIGTAPGAQTQPIKMRRADEHQAQLLDIQPGDLVIDVLRLRYLDDRPTMLERLTFVEDVGRLLFDVDLDRISITEHLHEFGYGYEDVEHEIDAVAADADDARLLDLEEGSPILRLRRSSRDQHGRLFEASDDRYRSDIVRFTVSASGRSQKTGDHVIRRVGG